MPDKRAVDTWLEAAADAYEGNDPKKLTDRGLRFHATLDGMAVQWAVLRELRAIRAALEAQAPRPKR